MALSAVGSPQTLAQYEALRGHYGIHEAAGISALDTVFGSRTLEVSGVVVGSVKRKGELILLLANGENRTDEIHAKAVPDWLIGQEIKARLIVSAKRTDVGSEPVLTLLSVARDSEMQLVDARMREEEQSAAAKAAARPVASKPPVGKRARQLWSYPISDVTPIYAAYVRKINPRLSVDQSMHIAQALVGFSIQYGVDARLIVAIVVAESDFNPLETSSAGAMGLGQLMPGTAKDFGISNAYDTTANLRGTVHEIFNDLNRYKNQADNSYESLRLALAAYNAGIGAVARAHGVPNYRETQAYVKKVIKLYYKLCGINE